MAKGTPLNVKGMSVGDILNLDSSTLNSLSASEMRMLTQRLADASNKRISRMMKAKSTFGSGKLASQSPAIRALRSGKKQTGKIRYFTTDKRKLGIKSKEQAKGKYHKEFNRAKRFLESKTSTISGTRKAVRETEKSLHLKFQSKAQASRFWKAYTRILNRNRAFVGKRSEEGKRITTDDLVRETYATMFEGKKPTRRNEVDVDTLIENMERTLQADYEAQQEEERKEEKSPFSIVYEKIFPFGRK